MSFASFNVLLTSYDFLRSDFQVFTPIEWQALIIDEGQKMKNNDSRFFKKCMCLHAQFKVLLSGTPLQNNIEELFNLNLRIKPVLQEVEGKSRENKRNTEWEEHNFDVILSYSKYQM